MLHKEASLGKTWGTDASHSLSDWSFHGKFLHICKFELYVVENVAIYQRICLHFTSHFFIDSSIWQKEKGSWKAVGF